MALTKAQRTRLEKLATYLEGLPADYGLFEMATYVDADNFDAEVSYARKNGGVQKCGTAACAVGHGPAAGILVPPSLVRDSFVDWSGYERAMFTGGRDDGELSWFLFSGGWKEIDNSHYGAAARIRYVLATGDIPTEKLAREETVSIYAPYRIDAKAPANA